MKRRGRAEKAFSQTQLPLKSILSPVIVIYKMEKNCQVSRFVIPKPINAEPSTDHCRICRRYNLKLNWERCLSQKNLQPRPKGFSPISVLPGILGRPGGLLTQIQFALTSFSFLLHANWVDCLSFPLRVVILLKMWALEFQFLLRVSSLKGPYYCRSISRRMPFGETSTSQV